MGCAKQGLGLYPVQMGRAVTAFQERYCHSVGPCADHCDGCVGGHWEGARPPPIATGNHNPGTQHSQF